MAGMTIWADKPLPLLTPPQSKQADPSKPENDYIGAASEMCLVHNFIIRGYNSIVLQAPYVKREDYSDFVNYSICWLNLIREHHDGEEKMFFPKVEQCVGEACMQGNIDQHRMSLFSDTVYYERLTNNRSLPRRIGADTDLSQQMQSRP